MRQNDSPWIRQLARTRPVATLERIGRADVAIVGGGIAGVVTAYFILTKTDKSVALLEADKVAHGATGHNAGQLVAQFERPVRDLVAQFGFDLAMDGVRSVERAWQLLDEIVADAQLQTPLSTFRRSVGYVSETQLALALEEHANRDRAGLPFHPVLVREDAAVDSGLLARYRQYVARVSKETLLALLESKDDRYIAVSQTKAGCMNSALFTEELTAHLIERYPERFILSEHTPVEEVVLYEGSAALRIPQGEAAAGRVILCTNGFEKITITNTTGVDIDTRFHHDVEGYVGYMAAYTDSLDRPPTALTYYDTPSTDPDDPYFYLTRRPYDLAGTDPRTNLVSVGGPGVWMEDSRRYRKDGPYPEAVEAAIKAFTERTYVHAPEHTRYLFTWHGLMGFTRNYLRLVGFEPCNPALLYNLGCNGIGILPSIFGGHRLARILAGEAVERSIFDPEDHRCELSPLPGESTA